MKALWVVIALGVGVELAPRDHVHTLTSTSATPPTAAPQGQRRGAGGGGGSGEALCSSETLGASDTGERAPPPGAGVVPVTGPIAPGA